MINNMALLLTLLVGIFFLIGLLITAIIKNKNGLVRYSVALAFIVLISLIVLDLLPELYEIFAINNFLNGNMFIVILLIILGIGILLALDSLIPDHHHDHKDNEKNLKEHNSHLYHIGLITLLSLFIHNVIEGMAIYAIALTDIKMGILMCLGVGLHNIPLGIEISATMLNNRKKSNALFITLLCLSTFIGGFIIFLFGAIPETVIGYIIAISVGMCIYISIFELLGEIKRNIKHKSTILGIISGVIISLIMLFL